MELEKQVAESIRAHRREIAVLNDSIWKFAETGFHLPRSADLFQRQLQAAGFSVEWGVAGIPDGFLASYGSGKPVLALLAEYDAVPGLSQAVCPDVRPLKPGAAGHGCGRNVMAAGAFAAALAIRDYLKDHPGGTVRLYGCPAAEDGWAKTYMTRDGCFADVDAALAWQPDSVNRVTTQSSLAAVSLTFRFQGRAAHASVMPEFGRSALDACELTNVGVNYLREHMATEARIHYAYLDAGGPAPSLVPASAVLHYVVRAPHSSQALELAERVKNVARGAAMMTGTQVEIQVMGGMSELIPNHTLGRVLQAAFQAAGAPEFGAKDRALASAFYDSLPTERKQAVENLWQVHFRKNGALAAAPLCTWLEPFESQLTQQVEPDSTDLGDVSFVTPLAQIHVASACLGTISHSWQMAGQSGSNLAHKSACKAGQILALAAIRLLESPDLLRQAREELQQRTGGRYPCPIPSDLKPPA